jgi:hypothetical protein
MSNTNLIVKSNITDTSPFLKNVPSVNINSKLNDTSLKSNTSDISSISSSENNIKKKNYFIELFSKKTFLYTLVSIFFILVFILVYLIYYGKNIKDKPKSIIKPNTYIDTNTYMDTDINIDIDINKCPQDCSKYINGDININGKICKVPVICPTNCVYEKEDNYVKYGDCDCDIDNPIKKPNILVEPRGENIIKCPNNISCNDCKLILKIADIIPLNPIKTNLIINFEPLKKSIYITKYYFKLHIYSNNNNSTIQMQFVNNIDKKILFYPQIINISNNENNKEIIFNINMNQPMLINSDSIIKLFISNPNKDDIIIDYLSPLIIEYKNIL